MASGDTLVVFTPLHNAPGDADYATLDTILTASADEPNNIVPVLDFDPGATNEFAYFMGWMPNHYAGTTGVTVTLVWSASATATTGNCIWNVAFKLVSDDGVDLDDTAFGAPNAVTVTTANVNGEVDYADITFTDGADMNSVVANRYFWIEVSRDSANASDTLNSDDAELHLVIIKET